MPPDTCPCSLPRSRAFAAVRIACAACAVVGCASTPSGGPTPVEDAPEATRTESLRATQGQGLVAYHPTPNRARIIDFPASAEALWPRVIGAYERVGIPLGEVDGKARTLGTSSVRVLGRLGDTRVGEYIDCGAGPLGMRLTDTYIVLLRAVTELRPPAGSRAAAPPGQASLRRPEYTTVRTLVTATAKPNSTQGDPVDCVSTGRLETRLARLIDPASPLRAATPAR